MTATFLFVIADLSFYGLLSSYDEFQSDEMKAIGMEYVDRQTVFRESDIISLHIPLLPTTYHLIDR